MNISEIIEFLNPISFTIHEENEIIAVKSIDDSRFDSSSLGWCSDSNAQLLNSVDAGTILISEKLESELESSILNKTINRIVVENPRKSFAEILKKYFVKKQPVFGNIHPSVVIDPSVFLSKSDVIFGPNVVLEENVIIGKGVIIGANTVIKSETIIQDNVKIGSNCTI